MKKNLISKITIVLLLPVIIILFLGMKFYDSINYKDSYSIDLNKENFGKKTSQIYIDENPENNAKFGRTNIINGEYSLETLSSPITFSWQPKYFIFHKFLNKRVVINAEIKGEKPWSISPVYKDGSYDYRQFYYPEINNYHLAKRFGETNIYAKKEKDWQGADNIEEWLLKNAPTGTAVRILDDTIIGKEKFVNKDIIEDDGNTEFTEPIQKDLSFYAYLDKKINMSLNKTDLNLYDGSDEIKITIFDLGDKKIFENTIPDDGTTSSSGEISKEPIAFKIIKDISQKGIYKISIESLGDYEDWQIDKFNINTNKIVNFDDYDPSSVLKNSFEPFVFKFTPTFKDADFAIGQYSFSKDENDHSWIKIEKTYLSRDLPYNEKDKNVSFSLNNKELKGDEKFGIDINNYKKLTYFDELTLWGKKDLSNEAIKKLTDMNLWLKKNLTTSYLGFKKEEDIDKKEFTKNDLNIDPNNKTVLSFSLRGPHQFYVYLGDKLDLKISKKDLNWYEGSDEISVRLLSLNGSEICKTTLSDDENISKDQKNEKIMTGILLCEDIRHGMYRIDIEETSPQKNGDFIIARLEINTDKIVLKDRIQFTSPMNLYFNNTLEENLKFYFWNTDSDQEIIFNSKKENKELILTKDDIKKEVPFILTPNNWEIKIPKGGLIISGSNFALSKENWFDVNSFKSEFLITRNKDEVSTSYFKTISIKVE